MVAVGLLAVSPGGAAGETASRLDCTFVQAIGELRCPPIEAGPSDGAGGTEFAFGAGDRIRRAFSETDPPRPAPAPAAESAPRTTEGRASLGKDMPAHTHARHRARAPDARRMAAPSCRTYRTYDPRKGTYRDYSGAIRFCGPRNRERN